MFKASKTIAAALVEIEPGGMRELHWHPNADEWQYYISGQARMTVFAAENNARTFDFQAGDVGSCRLRLDTTSRISATTMLRFLEVFRSRHFADVSLSTVDGVYTIPKLVRTHLHLDKSVLSKVSHERRPSWQAKPARSTRRSLVWISATAKPREVFQSSPPPGK